MSEQIPDAGLPPGAAARTEPDDLVEISFEDSMLAWLCDFRLLGTRDDLPADARGQINRNVREMEKVLRAASRERAAALPLTDRAKVLEEAATFAEFCSPPFFSNTRDTLRWVGTNIRRLRAAASQQEDHP